VEIAGSKGRSHLGAISEWTRLAAVTDILIQRGDTGVVRKLSQNQGATFSDRGYVTLASILSSVSDKVLRKATGFRDFSRAIARIDKVQSTGQLNDQAIAGFAAAGQHEELTVALAPLVHDARRTDRTADAERPSRRHPRCLQGGRLAVADLLSYDLSATDISQTKSDYLKLSVPTARRMLRGATKTDA